MARRKSDKAHVLGPYADRETFKIVHVKKDGTRVSTQFATRAEAQHAADELREQLERGELPGRSLRDALRDYETYMRDDKGNKPRSVEQTRHKLRRFFDVLDVDLSSLTPEKCAQLYEELRKSKRKPPTCIGREPKAATKPISVDYHRNALSEAKTFLKWCVKQKWLVANPLAEVEGFGKRRHGKEQLRIDEARKWIAKAVELADQNNDGAVAAMTTLIMGMRCTEVISRVVRDLDDDGRLLWIPDAKTPKGRRTLEVPPVLRGYFAELAEGKQPDDLLFGLHERAWPRNWVKRICKEADVPVVTAHGQRGLHSTLAIEAGVTSRAVADALGHESFTTTVQSYAKAEAVHGARQRRTLRVLAGGLGQEAA